MKIPNPFRHRDRLRNTWGGAPARTCYGYTVNVGRVPAGLPKAGSFTPVDKLSSLEGCQHDPLQGTMDL